MAIEWMERLLEAKPKTLYRGQNQIYKNVYPSMFRQSEKRKDAILGICLDIAAASPGTPSKGLMK